MHIEVQVALNFVISYLYNKLPRRRVNIFGEELEKALKEKFKGHWYPERPFKGSAFRCLKTGDPIDQVLERAAKESGVPIQDILENLPAELAVWVDPGEVSYRIGETSIIKILYSESADLHDECSADREVTKTFNPEAQCFRPIEAVGTSLSGLSLSPKSTSPFPTSLAGSGSGSGGGGGSSSSNGSNSSSNGSNSSNQQQQNGHASGSSSAPSPTPLSSSFKSSPSPVPSFIPRTTAPLTFTTATFAQTKFGSTKLKTSSKRANRMSPTEFSNYIKQRAIQQQIHHHNHHPQHPQQQGGLPTSQTSPNSRSLSPGVQTAGGQPVDPSAYFLPHTPAYHPQFPHRSLFDSSGHSGGYLPADIYTGTKFPTSYLDPTSIGHQFYGTINSAAAAAAASQQTSGNLTAVGSTNVISSSSSSNNNNVSQQQADKTTLVEGLNNFGLGSVTPYPANQYQHLLVAN